MSLADRIEALPSGPGVYLFKSRSGKVLYVGKAQNLRTRVRSYVSGGDGRVRVPLLVERAADDPAELQAQGRSVGFGGLLDVLFMIGAGFVLLGSAPELLRASCIQWVPPAIALAAMAAEAKGLRHVCAASPRGSFASRAPSSWRPR